MPNPHIDLKIDERGSGAHIAYVTVHNEQKLNTLNSALMDEFVAALEKLSGDAALRAVVVTGAGSRAFIGGADVNEMANLDAVSSRAFITRLHRCCEACGQFRRSKGNHRVVFLTLYGDVAVTSPRLHRCPCQNTQGPATVSPLSALIPDYVAPERLYLEARWASRPRSI